VLHLALLISPASDDFGKRAVRRAEFQRPFVRLREDRAAVLLDRFGKGRFVRDLDAPMMDARARARPLASSTSSLS
jgi:hypothetical protein